jgi:hypothetical protein
MEESLVNSFATDWVKLATHGTKELNERKFSVLVGVKVLKALTSFKLVNRNTEWCHGVLELLSIETSVSIAVKLCEQKAKSAETSGLLTAAGHQQSANISEVAHLDVLLNVRVANVEVAASSAHALNSFLLFCEVNVSFVTEHSFGLVERLSESTGHSEGVRSGGSSHVSVLAFEGLCVDSNRAGLSVITCGDASTELGITVLSRAAVHTSLNDELLVTMIHGNEFTILSTHDLATNNVAGKILLVVSGSICGVEVADLTLAGLLVSLGLLLGLNLC